MNRHARLGAFALAVGAGAAALLFACASDRSFSDTQEPDASPDVASLPPPGEVSDAAPIDAADDYVVPDGAVECGDAAPCIVSIAGGAGTFCALRSDGKVACWGTNFQGQLGYDAGDGVFSSGTARTLANLEGVTAIDIGDTNTCARTSDGGLYCWGVADLVNAGITAVDGGVPLDSPVMTPTRETAVPAAETVGVGGNTACVTSTGALVCWGKNDALELGRGPTVDPFAPPAPANLGGHTASIPRLASLRSFAITSSGELASWGASSNFGSGGFFLGRDTSEDPDGVPAMVPALNHVRALASGQAHSCAIAGRYVECWGSNDTGQLGRGTFDYHAWLPDLSRVTFTVEAEDIDAGATESHDVPLDVAATNGSSCVAMGSGRVYCWGANGGGQLGSGIPAGSASLTGYPTRIRNLDGPAVRVAASNATACALLRSGVVECWGANYSGELGRGSVDDVPHPKPALVHFTP